MAESKFPTLKIKIMKNKILLTLLFSSLLGIAQEKMITKTGKVIFEASVASFEEVKAKNENVTCILNPKNGEIAALVLMKGFRFKIALMEEHFKENYVESDTYPKATFKGKIEGFDFSNLTATAKEYTLKGKLELHGKTKDIITIAKIRKVNNAIEILSNFNVNTEDFNIEIPSVVSNKVAKKVNLNLNFLLN
jgi:hypothetical protein